MSGLRDLGTGPPAHEGPFVGAAGRSPGSRPALQAVLWDMDGTLVNTEPYWIAGERRLVHRYGGSWTDSDSLALLGLDLLEAAVYIQRRGGVRMEPEAIVEDLLDGVIDQVRDHVPWQPGARELLAALRTEGVPCALVTMSYRRLAQEVVDALPAGTFAAVVAGDEVARGKPHPEPYLRGAELLGVDPAGCVALEDSPTGAASANAAGCYVVGVPHAVVIPVADRRSTVNSLADLTVAGLRALVRV